MDEMGDEHDLCEQRELGFECYLEVRDALAETLECLQPMLAAKYPIGDVAVRHYVAKALICNAVDIYTEASSLDQEDLENLCLHVEFLIRGAEESCGSDLEPE